MSEKLPEATSPAGTGSTLAQAFPKVPRRAESQETLLQGREGAAKIPTAPNNLGNILPLTPILLAFLGLR
jgi:hypothetical protein